MEIATLILENCKNNNFARFTRTLCSSQLVPAALEVAMEEDVEFRRGLPLDYLTYMGVQNSEKVISYFNSFLSESQSLADIKICKVKQSPQFLNVHAGGQTQGKVLDTNGDPNKKAAGVRSC